MNKIVRLDAAFFKELNKRNEGHCAELIGTLHNNYVIDEQNYEEIVDKKFLKVVELPGLELMVTKFENASRNLDSPPDIFIPEFLKAMYDQYGMTYLVQFANKMWVCAKSFASDDCKVQWRANSTGGAYYNYDINDVFSSSMSALTVAVDIT